MFKSNMDILWMAIQQDPDSQKYYNKSAVSEEVCSFVLLSKNSIIILIF